LGLVTAYGTGTGLGNHYVGPILISLHALCSHINRFVSTTTSQKQKRAVSSIHQMMDIPVPPFSDLALTEAYPPTKFTTLPKLTATVSFHREDMVNRNNENQYLSFNHVTEKGFERIKKHQVKLGHVRFTYFADIETLQRRQLTLRYQRRTGSRMTMSPSYDNTRTKVYV
jgi:hypothetical protein